MLPNKAGPAMTENLAKYLPFALRVGVDNHLVSEQLEKKIILQNQVRNNSRDHFLVDAKFFLMKNIINDPVAKLVARVRLKI